MTLSGASHADKSEGVDFYPDSVPDLSALKVNIIQ